MLHGHASLTPKPRLSLPSLNVAEFAKPIKELTSDTGNLRGHTIRHQRSPFSQKGHWKALLLVDSLTSRKD